MILHITPRYNPLKCGGAERQLGKLAPKLNAMDLETAILTWDGGHHGLPAYEMIGGVAVYRLKERWIKWDGRKRLSGLYMGVGILPFLLSMRKRIRLVHVHAFTELAFFAKLWCSLLRIPCVAKVTGVGSIYEGVRSRRGLLGKFFWYFMTRRGWVIAITPRMKEPLESYGVPKDRILILNNAVDIPHKALNQCARDNNALVIAAVSSLICVKRLDIFIKTAGILSREYPEVKWLIAGDGPERLSLERLCASCGLKDKITWLGHVDNVGLLLCDVDILVHPSEREGASNSMLEAMAWGLPVVARRGPFNAELINDGITGFTFDGTQDDLAACLRRLIADKNLRLAIGNAARDHVANHYAFTGVCKQYISILEHLGIWDQKM